MINYDLVGKRYAWSLAHRASENEKVLSQKEYYFSQRTRWPFFWDLPSRNSILALYFPFKLAKVLKAKNVLSLETPPLWYFQWPQMGWEGHFLVPHSIYRNVIFPLKYFLWTIFCGNVIFCMEIYQLHFILSVNTRRRLKALNKGRRSPWHL